MTLEAFEKIKRDLASFADDEHDMICDQKGNFIFERHGKMMNIQIKEDDDSRVFVVFNGIEIPYKQFLSRELAKLDVLASKILLRSTSDTNYVDSDVTLMNIDERIEGKASDVLFRESKTNALIGTKICFVTADAGHGKSMLLKHFQHSQANKFIEGNTNYLFWHIDLHGRDLVRLNEAIMYDLGELRISGLYYSSIMTLMRNHLIVLGIDGFDELAAEKGGETALNSLSNLLSQMQGKGVLIAASRRAFFNSQDYLKRTGILHQNIGSGCTFNEIRIKNWQKEQCVDYLQKYTFNEEDYDKLYDVLRNSHHPLLERPYLFTKLVEYSYEDSITPSEFVCKNGDNRLDNINDVIEAFIHREVDKWTHTDRDTGRPYLSFEQHMRLLSELAHDMWSTQKNTITVENIQLILTILFDEWKTDSQMQPLILRMVESHAMLINVEGRDNYRKFDHEEFKCFFLSRALENVMSNSVIKNDFSAVYKFLYIAQLPDTVAQYLSTHIDKSLILKIVEGLKTIRKKEWKPTYIQSNIGTLLPYLLNGFDNNDIPIVIDDKTSFSSLIFENKNLKHIIFKNCVFVNISFNNTQLNCINFDNCSFTGIKVSMDSQNSFKNVKIYNNCDINMVSLVYPENEEVYTEYSPFAINELLGSLGFEVDCTINNNSNDEISEGCHTEFYKIVKRILNKYSKTTSLYESNILQSPQYNYKNPDLIINEIIPLLEKYNIIELKENNKTRQAGTKAWILSKYDIPAIFKAEEDKSSALWSFWEEVKKHN